MTRRAAMRRTRRGLTILEVVIAVAILALVAGMVSAALSNLLAARDRAAYRLAAAEAAHRIILQYNDDALSIARATAPVEVDGFVFAFDASESVIDVGDFTQGARVTPTRRSRADLPLTEMLSNRLWRIDVSIVSTGDGPGWRAGEEVLAMHRTFDLLTREDVYDILLQELGGQLDER
jgi:prepilin-type N-terminal cleavage/methylation domain-containing protein